MFWAFTNIFVSLKKLSKLDNDSVPVFAIRIFKILSVDHQVHNEFEILWDWPFGYIPFHFFKPFIVFNAIIWEINFLTFCWFFLSLISFIYSSKNLLPPIDIALIFILIFILILLLLFLIYFLILFLSISIIFLFIRLFYQKNFECYR
jgi:hypothetical protein